LITVSNISVGAGSVAVDARPAFPQTDDTSGNDLMILFTFVPAGHEYYERQEPLSLARMVFFYFDPTQMPSHPEMAIGSTALAPRLFKSMTRWPSLSKWKSEMSGQSRHALPDSYRRSVP
jgi:hypothetical protein